jgi:hypothetical protein
MRGVRPRPIARRMKNHNLNQGLSGGLSKGEFARAMGVSGARVSQWVKAGLPVRPDGRVELEAGAAWVKERADPRRREAYAERLIPRSEARDIRERAEAEIARLKAAKLAGRLIEKEATLRAVEARARFERESWLGFVTRAGPEIAAVAGAGLPAVVAVLDRLIRDQLAQLAAAPLELDK